jgi:hypothetical protein
LIKVSLGGTVILQFHLAFYSKDYIGHPSRDPSITKISGETFGSLQYLFAKSSLLLTTSLIPSYYWLAFLACLGGLWLKNGNHLVFFFYLLIHDLKLLIFCLAF